MVDLSVVMREGEREREREFLPTHLKFDFKKPVILQKLDTPIIISQ
jgi:hypothetical protein